MPDHHFPPRPSIPTPCLVLGLPSPLLVTAADHSAQLGKRDRDCKVPTSSHALAVLAIAAAGLPTSQVQLHALPNSVAPPRSYYFLVSPSVLPPSAYLPLLAHAAALLHRWHTGLQGVKLGLVACWLTAVQLAGVGIFLAPFPHPAGRSSPSSAEPTGGHGPHSATIIYPPFGCHDMTHADGCTGRFAHVDL